jgi:hypothetical protein
MKQFQKAKKDVKRNVHIYVKTQDHIPSEYTKVPLHLNYLANNGQLISNKRKVRVFHVLQEKTACWISNAIFEECISMQKPHISKNPEIYKHAMVNGIQTTEFSSKFNGFRNIAPNASHEDLVQITLYSFTDKASQFRVLSKEENF